MGVIPRSTSQGTIHDCTIACVLCHYSLFIYDQELPSPKRAMNFWYFTRASRAMLSQLRLRHSAV